MGDRSLKQVVLISGTSTGLGQSIALLAAKRGWTVYATMRDIGKASLLQDSAKSLGIEVKLLQMDVQDSASVTAAVAVVMAAEGRIDVLINNAGSGFVRTTEQATEADAQWIMDVNFMGVLRATKAVLPHMRAARSGRVINISSVGGLVGQPFNEIYCASKFAVEGYTESLASYVTPSFGVHFTAVEPGGIRSEFATSALRHIAETGGMLKDEYAPILQTYFAGFQQRGSSNSQTPDEVAQVVLEVMASDNPPVRVRTSDWAEAFCHVKTSADPDGKLLQEQVIKQFL
jgi:NAD(P)-dependent dehydrogenase (short-subunit alcohol dehydrogenase family)